jgi:hypothetical protein
MPFVREIPIEFSVPPEFSGNVLEKDFSTGWALTFDQILFNCATASFSKVSVATIMRLSGRFFSYWQQDFPAISVLTGRDFPAVSVVTGRDFPAVSAVTDCGIFRRYL